MVGGQLHRFSLRTVEQKLQAICVGRDGAIFAAGSGRILRLDHAGKVIASAVSPVTDAPVVMGPDIDKMLKEMHMRFEAALTCQNKALAES